MRHEVIKMKLFKRTVTVFLAVAVLALTLTATGISAASGTRTVSGKFNYDYANQVLSLVNSERAKQGLNSLSMDDKLVDGANIRAAECTVSFSHTRPNGTSCFTAFEWQNTVGENIAYGQRTPQQVMNGWMNSQGHRENILKQGFKKIGIGCFVAQNGTIYWTQEFSGGAVSKTYSRSGSESATVEVSLSSNSQSKVDKTTPAETQKPTSATQPTTKQKATQPTTSKKNNNTQNGNSCPNGNCNNSLSDLLSKLCPNGNCNSSAKDLLSKLCPNGNCDSSTKDLLSKLCPNGNCNSSTKDLLSKLCPNGNCNSSAKDLLSKLCPNGNCNSSAKDLLSKLCPNGNCNFTNNSGNSSNKYVEPSESKVSKPSAPSLKSVAACKKCFTAKWSKSNSATSYKLCCALNKSFTKSKICKTVSSSKTSLKVSGLKSGKTYYVRVRSCNTAGCSSWSGTKSVTIR